MWVLTPLCDSLMRGYDSSTLSLPVTIVLVQLLTCSPLCEHSVCSRPSSLPLTCCSDGYPSGEQTPNPGTSPAGSSPQFNLYHTSGLCATVRIILKTLLLLLLPATVLTCLSVCLRALLQPCPLVQQPAWRLQHLSRNSQPSSPYFSTSLFVSINLLQTYLWCR